MAALDLNATPHSGTPEPNREEANDEKSGTSPTQAISGRNIDPAKLKILLRIKFGAGAYNIHVSLLLAGPVESNIPTIAVLDHAELLLHCRATKAVECK
jgi:hypothetical protein